MQWSLHFQWPFTRILWIWGILDISTSTGRGMRQEQEGECASDLCVFFGLGLLVIVVFHVCVSFSRELYLVILNRNLERRI
jgi:hypothetical protein